MKTGLRSSRKFVDKYLKSTRYCFNSHPSVISTAEEPIPGWINNTYGPTGIVAAAGLGLMRTLHCDKNCKADVVPCDYVINALIASAWYTAKRW